MDKRFWGFLIAVAIVFSGIFFFSSSNKAGAPSRGAGTLTNHVVGSDSTGVKLTEYGDFQCPACAQYYPLVKQVKDKYKDQIQFQFRNFPLFQIHPNAIASARAAEAADMQGKFWEMHDLLYENQQSWSSASAPQAIFEGYAKQLNLDVTKFTSDFKSSKANDRIQADLREGNRLKVESTPTFFIDGKKISNPTSLEDFYKVIDNAIEQKTGKKPAASEPATDLPTPAPAPEQ